MNHSLRDRVIGWLLVAVQAALIGAVVLLPRDPVWDWGVWADWIGWTAVAVGVAVGLWGVRHLGSGLTPLPLPNGRVRLVTRGPYRLVRHPLYAAVILATGGLAVVSRTPLVAATAVFLAVFLFVKARWEESHLRSAFPGYDDYAVRTPMFIPIRRPIREVGPGSGRSADG